MTTINREALEQAVDAMQSIVQLHAQLSEYLDMLREAQATLTHTSRGGAAELLAQFLRGIKLYEKIPGIPQVMELVGKALCRDWIHGAVDVVALDLADMPPSLHKLIAQMGETRADLRVYKPDDSNVAANAATLEVFADMIHGMQRQLFATWLAPMVKSAE
jgi:hypothetical protein